MSLPIPTSLLIQGAASLAGGLAQHVGDALDFDQVLRGGAEAESAGAEPTTENGKSASALMQQFVDAIRDRLQRAGMEVNQPLQLRVEADGKTRVESNHPEAARAEAEMADSPQLARLGSRLVHANGGQAVTLTIPSGGVNILSASGGYPNW